HMSFAPQAGQSGTLMRIGCLLFKDGRFILQDENSQEVVELTGPDLAANLGNRVQITGTASATKPAVTIATSVMTVTAVSPRSQGGCLVAASALDARTDLPPGAAGAAGTAKAGTTAAGTAGTAPKAGLSTGAKVGIIAAIAGGGAAGGIVALQSKKK